MPGNPKDSPWYATPRADRKRRPVEVTLSDEAREILDELAKEHGSRSAAVEALVLATARPKKRGAR